MNPIKERINQQGFVAGFVSFTPVWCLDNGWAPSRELPLKRQEKKDLKKERELLLDKIFRATQLPSHEILHSSQPKQA